MFKKILFISISILSLIFIYLGANNDLWRYHLESDVKTFYSRFEQFSSDGNFSNFDKNEYLPGSLFFFIVPGVFNKNINYENYLNNFMLINLFLIAVHLVLYMKMFKSSFEYLPILIFIAIGPILLFRFELITSLMLLVSIYLFTKNKPFLSGIFMGISIIIKLYPLFLIPYFIILMLKNKQISTIVKYLAGIALGILIPIICYGLMQGNVNDASKIAVFHTDKPIMIESTFGSIESLKRLINTNTMPKIDVINNVWGITESSNIPLINLIPYFVLTIYYLVLLKKIKKGSNFNAQIPIFIILLFLFFSKYLNPQYLFWIFGLLPLINFEKGFKNIFLITNTIVILLLTQLTYPMYFNQLLEAFDTGPNLIFWVLQTRNLLLFIELIIFV